MRKQSIQTCVALLVATLVGSVPIACFGQSSKEAEDILPKELRSRVDVEVILEKLRFLRRNESFLGENHLTKKSIQAQIREYEFDLKSIADQHKSQPSKLGVLDGNANVENALSPEFAAREDVQPIIRKLKYLRMNNKYLGENHPSKKATEEQIRGHEFALNKMLEEDRSPSPKPSKSEPTDANLVNTVQDLENRRELRVILQKLEVLKVNQANFGENHPNWKIIQSEIREHESKFIELTHSPH